MSSVPDDRPLIVFTTVVALWFGAVGMQAVLLSWLVVGVLGAPAEVVGLVQMAGMAPVLLLLLLGGATADRVDRRRLLMGLHLGTGSLALVLALAVGSNRLSLPLLFGYAVGMGTLTAFALPARDAFLSDVAGGNLMRAATALTLAQFGAQAAGAFVAGSARALDLAPVIAFQALLMFAGIAAAARLPRARPTGAAGRLGMAELGAGVREVARSPTLRSTVLALSGVGLFFAGAYHVVMPVVIRDHFAGDVTDLSLFMSCLQLGVVCGAALLLVRGHAPRRGRTLVLSLAGAGLPILALAAGPPFLLALVAAFAWGLCVALFNSIGRAIIQENAPEAQRARVLAIYSLALMGAQVVGSPFAGWLASRVGGLAALAFAAVAIQLFMFALALLTPVWRID
ncbi:MAG: MFS transporter [Myxococcota bacterium]|nr:MFS transporter [Myxococcota bacterium]